MARSIASQSISRFCETAFARLSRHGPTFTGHYATPRNHTSYLKLPVRFNHVIPSSLERRRRFRNRITDHPLQFWYFSEYEMNIPGDRDNRFSLYRSSLKSRRICVWSFRRSRQILRFFFTFPSSNSMVLNSWWKCGALNNDLIGEQLKFFVYF